MADVTAKFSLNNENLNATFDLSEESTVDAVFKIDAAGTTWGSIDGILSNQKDLQAALDLKADKSTVEADFEALSDTVAENYTTLDNKIDSVQTDLSGDISALSNTVTTNSIAVNNRIDTTNTNLSNLQTNVNDNNTSINNRVDTLETSFDADIEELNTHLSDLADTVGNNYTDLSGQINETNVNLASLNTTVSNNYTTLDNKINGVNSELSGNIGELETELTELTTIVSNNNTAINQKVDTLETSLNNDINTLSGTVSSNYTTLDTKIDNTKTELEGDITTLSGTVTSNYNDLNSAITTSASTINSRIDSEVDDLNAAITSEATTRENADNNLQSQIDAITAASDVVDIVGTYAALQAYNTSHLQNNDIIKVLSDESRDDETTYYRWILTDGVGVWSFIGEEGPYYTKSEADSQFVPQTRTINNKALSENITLTASDVNALPDTTVIGDGVLTLQKNGVNIDTFNANTTTNKSINIEVPTTLSELTNDEGFITDAALAGYATTTDLTNGLATKQNTLTSENAGTGISIVNGVISNTQTSAQWGNITGELSNQADLASALNSKQPTLVSGENIKTLNGESLLGEGNIEINPSPDIDNTTITKNSSNELQAVGVIDENTEETLKAWKGTGAEFNAIETKNANTFYYVYDAGQIYVGDRLISNNYSQNVGAIVTSILPLTDAGLHLLDGSLIQGDGIYKEFVEYIAKLYEEGTASNCFTIETLWQESVSKYGECGKFVYDSTNNTVRLPKIEGIIQGTTNISALGNIVEAGLPNITGTFNTRTGNWGDETGAFYWKEKKFDGASNAYEGAIKGFDASRSNPIYGKSSTVQPQTVKVFYYIVVATTAKTDIQVNIDNIVTDLNTKAGLADSNRFTGQNTFTASNTFTARNNFIPVINSGGGINLYNDSVIKGTNPEATKYWGLFRCNDQTNEAASWQSSRLGIAELSLDTTGTSRLMLGVYKNEVNAAGAIGVSIAYWAGDATQRFYPNSDNVVILGATSNRFKQLYAATATINTSDERLKQRIENVPDEVLDAWGEVEFYQYKFNDAVKEKGVENARLHTGLIAQRIENIFAKHNLDAKEYGLLCYDEWDARPADIDENGEIHEQAIEAGNRYSLRYEECLCMEASYQRRRADKFEERLKRLEEILLTQTEELTLKQVQGDNEEVE